MTSIIKNQTNIDAVIVFEDGEPKMVVPDEIWVSPGESVTWIVVPPNQAQVVFGANDSPLEWESENDKDAIIDGTVQRNAVGIYNYRVMGSSGMTIDPRIRIKK